MADAVKYLDYDGLETLVENFKDDISDYNGPLFGLLDLTIKNEMSRNYDISLTVTTTSTSYDNTANLTITLTYNNNTDISVSVVPTDEE